MSVGDSVGEVSVLSECECRCGVSVCVEVG